MIDHHISTYAKIHSGICDQPLSLKRITIQ